MRMLNAQTLASSFAAQIGDAILAAIERDSIDRATVRRIVVRPASDQQTLLLTARDDWEDCDDRGEPEDAFAELSLAEWLDAIDAIGPDTVVAPSTSTVPLADHPVRFIDPALDAAYRNTRAMLRDGLVEALRRLARCERLGRFKRLLGFQLGGASPSGYADTIAFLHPHGDLQLWPISEEIDGDRNYTIGSFPPTGVTIFFPEAGDDAPTCHEVVFADVDRFWQERSDIFVLMRGARAPIRLTNGHTYNEWGGPDQADVVQAIVAHFQAHLPTLEISGADIPWPDGPALDAWCRAQANAKPHLVLKAFETHLGKHGYEAGASVLGKLAITDEYKGRFTSRLITAAMAAKRFAEALLLIEGLAGNDRNCEFRDEFQALRMLGRADEAVRRAAAFTGRMAQLALPSRALALADLGREAEGRALLEDVAKDDQDGTFAWAQARCLYPQDPAAAVAALGRALVEGTSRLPFAAHDLRGCPELLAMLAERDGLLRQRDADEAAVVPVKLEAVPAQPWPSPDAGPVVATWRVQEHTRIPPKNPLEPQITALATTASGRRFIGLKRGGLGEIVVEDGKLAIRQTLATDNSCEDVAAAGNLLVVADWNGGMRLFDASGAGAPTELPAPPALLDGAVGTVLANDSIAALRTRYGVGIVDLGTRRLVAVRGTECRAVALDGTGLAILTATDLRLYDVSTPAAPRLVAAVNRPVDNVRNVWLCGRLIVLATDKETLCYDLSRPTDPRLVARYSGTKTTRAVRSLEPGRILVCEDDGANAFLLDAATGRCVTACELYSDDGARLAVDGPVALQPLPDGGLILAWRYGVQRLARGERVQVEPLYVRRVRASVPALVDLVRQTLERTAGPVGSISLWMAGGMDVVLEPQRSVLSLQPYHHPDDQVLARATHKLDDLKSTGAGEDADAVWTAAHDAALEQVAERVLVALAQTPAPASLAGRVLLAVRSHDGNRVAVVGTWRTPGRPWSPERRAPVARGAKTVAELLEDYDNIDKVVAKARNDEAVRREVYAAMLLGHMPAWSAAWELRTVDEAAVCAAFIAVSRSPHVLPEIIERLAALRARPEAEARLQEMFASPAEDLGAGDIIALAQTLGQCDHDRMVALARSLLATCNCSRADAAVELIGSMQTRVAELLPDLLAWVERAEDRDNRLGVICQQLFRAGHRQVPDKLVPLAKVERQHERYASVKLTPETVANGFEDERGSDECRAERMFTGFALAERVARLRSSGDVTEPVWPDGWEPEPFTTSWKYLLGATIPHLLQAGTLAWFTEVLARHASEKASYPHDFELLCAFLEYLEHADEPALLARASQAIQDSADGHAAAVERRRVIHRRLQQGWELVKAKDIPGARALATELLAAEPDDGQILFFDARIAWLEADSPAAGRRVAEAHLKRASGDAVGLAKLLNLIGCSLDAEGKAAEAVDYFHRALQAHDGDPTYLRNLAEVYEKLGKPEEAARFKRRAEGHGKDIVSQLLA